MAGLKLVCIAVVCMVLASASVDAGINCGQVVGYLGPCINYAKGMGALTTGCCDGIKNLNNAAKTTPDRQATCNCMKLTASGIRGINYGIVESLPGRCGVSIPYKISPSTDCSRVQ